MSGVHDWRVHRLCSGGVGVHIEIFGGESAAAYVVLQIEEYHKFRLFGHFFRLFGHHFFFNVSKVVLKFDDFFGLDNFL